MPEHDRTADLAQHRAAIDRLDREILVRLNERAAHAQAIGALKADGGGPAYRPEREAQVLARLSGENTGPLSAEQVTGVFRQVMSACLALEQKLHIAYLGPAGTFSHAAVHRHFGGFVDSVACATIDEVFRASESGRADYAVVPVENSSEGAVGRTLDLMCTTDLSICGEIKLRIQQNLLSNAAALADVTKVYSHAQSLAQCVQWLARHLPGVARVATRFWVLGRQKVAPSGRDETSLVMSAPNKPGALLHLLEPLAKHGVSMTRFESRPARTGLWEYLFFVDFAGHEADPPVAAALAELKVRAPFLKLLGSYPAATA
jgi:chorismate mutase/prephenate dehydratase